MAAAKVSPWGFVGMGGMACVLFLDLGTANVAPWWVTVLFLLLWVVLFVLAVRWFVPQPDLGAVAAAGGVRDLAADDRAGHPEPRLGRLSLAQPTGSTRSTESLPVAVGRGDHQVAVGQRC